MFPYLAAMRAFIVATRPYVAAMHRDIAAFRRTLAAMQGILLQWLRYPDRVHPSPAATSSYFLPPLPYARLRFTLRATEPSALPPFKGSLLRGAFGHALRRAACAMGPEQPCETCRLRAVCVYTRVFETYVASEQSHSW